MTAPPSVAPCRVGPWLVGPGEAPLLVAGPCVLEGEPFALRHAERLAAMAEAAGFRYCFKSSFDKANRTSSRTYRGPGLREGLRMLEAVSRRVGVPVLTDVHESSQAAAVAEVAQVLQIPAFLCRQTDLLEAAGRTGRAINVKKGQFLAPEQMRGVVEKLQSVGARDILLTERGVSFGYATLVVDFRALPIMRSLGHPVLFDGTHSVQRPGGLGDRSGGDRREVPLLVRAAAAVGVDGFFLEVHEDPDRAPSDGPNMLRLEDLPALLGTIQAIRAAAFGRRESPSGGVAAAQRE